MSRRFAGAGESRRNGRGVGFAVGGFVGALDALSAAPAAWYDVARRDFASYTGALCRIQRTSDNAELDIGYASDGWLDTAAIAAHCSGTTGRVKTFYDQSGNTRDLTQPTHSLQPIIYTGGALVVLSTKAAMDFDGTGTFLARNDACGLGSLSAYTLVSVADADATFSRWVFHIGAASYVGNAATMGQWISATSMQTHHGSSSTTYGSLAAGTGTSPHYALHMLAAAAQTGNAVARVNGANATETAEANPTMTTVSMTNSKLLLGCANNGANLNFFDGRQTAFGVWASVLAGADLTAVEAACAGLIV